MNNPAFPAVGDDNRIQDRHLPTRLSEESLLALIRRESASAGVSSPGLDILAQKLAFGGAGNQNVAIVADSTMNDGNESARLFDRKYSAALSDSVRHVYHNWNAATSAWQHTVNSEGEITPAHDGLVLSDSFTRTGDLVGSSPDVGAAWDGRAGTWESDGAVARPTVSPAALTTNVGAKNFTFKTTAQITTSALGKAIRFYLGTSSSIAQSGIMVAANISSSGLASFRMYSGSTPIGTQVFGNSIGITENSTTAQSVEIQVQIDIQNVTMTVTGPTGSPVVTQGVISEAEYAALGTWAGVHNIVAEPAGIALDSVEITTDPTPAQGDTFDVWNGAIAGAKWLTFDNAKLTQMFGEVDVDVLILSMGHNSKTQTGEDFVTETQSWIGQWMTLHPETKGIIWVSQNPQFPPATSPAAHRDRQMAIRLASKELGLEYISGYEAFSVLPDGGVSYVQADGIHPTAPSGGALTGDFGAVLIADTIMKSVRVRI